MGYIEFTRLAISKVMLFTSIVYFLLQKTTTWIDLYFKHYVSYDRAVRLKILCDDPNIYPIVEQCSDPALASTWPLFTSLGTTMKESVFCGNVSCPEMIFSFLESWTGLIIVTTIVAAIGYTYVTQMKKRKYKKLRMRREEGNLGGETPRLSFYQT